MPQGRSTRNAIHDDDYYGYDDAYDEEYDAEEQPDYTQCSI